MRSPAPKPSATSSPAASDPTAGPPRLRVPCDPSWLPLSSPFQYTTRALLLRPRRARRSPWTTPWAAFARRSPRPGLPVATESPGAARARRRGAGAAGSPRPSTAARRRRRPGAGGKREQALGRGRVGQERERLAEPRVRRLLVALARTRRGPGSGSCPGPSRPPRRARRTRPPSRPALEQRHVAAVVERGRVRRVGGQRIASHAAPASATWPSSACTSASWFASPDVARTTSAASRAARGSSA